jgi:hypothetical protein
MAIPQQAPAVIKQALAIDASFASSFQTFVSQQAQLSAANIAAYQNTAPAVGSMVTTGEVLASASFFPAPPGAKYDAGRTGYDPTYFLLNRAGSAGASIASTSFLPLVQNFLDTPQNPICPHIVIGYGGDIVQLVDLANTAHYLQLGPQSPPNPLNLTPEGLIDAIIEFTAANEGGSQGYSTFTANDNGTGAAFGFIQFNQTVGTMYNLMVLMNQYSSADFNSIFGTFAPTLLNKSLLTNKSVTHLAPFQAQFAAAGQIPVFQQAQRVLARQLYFDPLVQVANSYALTSQRAFAMLFDTNVQGGINKVKKFLHTASSSVAATNISASDPSYQISLLTQFAKIADTSLTPSNNRRTKILTTSALSDGPLYSTLPPAQSSTNVLDASCVSIVLEGRYGDATTAAMLTSLAAVINQCSVGLGIPASPSRVVPWTTYDHPGVPADVTMGGFPFDTLFSQIQNPALSNLGVSTVFSPPQTVLNQPTQVVLQALLNSISGATTKGYKATVLHAYDNAKAQERANFLSSATRADFTAAAVTQTQNSVAQANSDASNVVTNANSTATTTLPVQANTVGLLFNFQTGTWSDGKAVGLIGS